MKYTQGLGLIILFPWVLINRFSWIYVIADTKMSSWHFHHWLHRKLPFWQHLVHLLMILSSEWQRFLRFNDVFCGCLSLVLRRPCEFSSAVIKDKGNQLVANKRLTHVAETKWPPFRRRSFQKHFLERKPLNFKQYFIEMYSLGSYWQYVIIGLDNGLAPNRRQAIIWTNDGLVY